MPLQKLQLRPGVNREGTTLANEGGWFECDKVRFRSGYPEKIGGWAAISYNTFLGTARSLWNWVTLKSYNLLGVGTNLKFYVEQGGVYNDITPIRLSTTNTTTFAAGYTTLNGNISAVATDITLTSGTNFVVGNGWILIGSEQITYASRAGVLLQGCVRGANGTTAAAHLSGDGVGSYIVTVTDSGASALQATDFVTYTQAASLGGDITAAVLNQEYQIISVLSSTQYTISPRSTVSSGNIATNNGGTPIAANASDVGNGGASTDAAYQISTGAEGYTLSSGWGTGPWSPYATVTLTNPFATVNGSGVLTVTQAGHGLATDDYVFFTYVETDVAGIYNESLWKAFQVTVLTTSTYTITSPVTANSTNAAVGGSVVVAYPSASIVGSKDRGWGTGFTASIGVQLRLWSQANFGENLLFSPRGGALYVWLPLNGTTPDFGTPGTLVSGTDVPSMINQIMVSDSSRIVIAFGCTSYSFDTPANTFDPLLIHWSAQESYTDWTPSATNQAGSYRLSHGSGIVQALQTRQEILVWTDSAIYAMQYLGPPYVYGFTLLADNISIVSPNAAATANGVTYWMGTDKFYTYSGRVETLPCSLRTYVYGDINQDQAAQFFAGTNEGFSEVWWFYCSITGPDGTGTATNPNTIIDRYVIFNYLDRVWYYGTMGRTAWNDSALRQYPQAATTTNLIVSHEAIVDNGETNPPSGIVSYIQSSDFDIGDGHNYGFVWRMIPDITFDGSTTASGNPLVTFTLRPRQNPGAPYGTTDRDDVTTPQSYATRNTYTVQEFTEIVYTRVRGRQMAFRVSSNEIGTQWQLGVPRIDVRPDGRR